MAGSWTGTSPRGVYKPTIAEDPGDTDSGAWKNFDTSLTNIHNKLWRDNIVNVKSDYSAAGDDSTDDTTAIQNAINSLGSTGGTVFLPQGTYKITSTLTITSGITLLGEGIHKSTSQIKAFNMDGYYAIETDDFDTTARNQIVLRNLSITANSTSGELAGAIRLHGYWMTLENIKTDNTDNINGAIRLWTSSDIVLNHVVVLGHSAVGVAGAGYGLKIEDSRNITGHIDAEGFEAGIWLDNSDANHLYLRSELNATDGVVLDNSNYNLIHAAFENCPTQWLDLRGTSKANHIWISRGTDTNVPAVPILIDSNTTGNYIYTDESYTANTNDVFIFTDDEIKVQKLVTKNFITFTDSDATPSVDGGNNFNTGTSTYTITMFDGGMQGQEIAVISKGAITYDVTGTNLKGGTTDIVTASGDLTKWIFDGTDWVLTGRMDMSDDLN